MPAERLRAVLITHVLTMLDEVEGATAHLQVEALAPALRDRIVAQAGPLRARACAGWSPTASRDGVFVTGNAALLTRAMLGALNWVVTWYRPGGRQTPRQIAERDGQLSVVRGVLKRP